MEKCTASLFGATLLLSVALPVHAQDEFKDIALGLMASNDFDAAIALINQAHERGQADAESYSLLADAYLNAGSGIPAEAAIDRARQLGADYAATAVPFAKSLLIQGQFRRALEALRGVSIPEADRSDALIITGDANFAQKDFDNARRFYLNAVQQYPEDFQAYLGLARLGLKEGNLDEAKTYADQAYLRSKDNTMVQYTRGLLARYAGDVGLAEEYFVDAVRLFPENVMANLELAGIRINQQRFEEAEQNLDTVYASTPKNPMALYLSGVILSSRGEYDEAEALLNRARVATENYLPALYVRGLVAYQLENNEIAIELLTRVLQVRPGNRTARLALSASYLRLQQPTNAYNTLIPLINQGQEDVGVLAMAAAILIAQGETERGRAMYERVALISGEEGVDAVNNLDTKLALAQFVAGDSENALSTLSLVTTSQAAQLRDLGVMGSMQIRTRDYEGARITIDKIISTSPDRALGYNMRGTLEFQLGDFDGAVQSYTQALTRKPDYYTALRNRGLALMNMRQYDRAESDLERLLEEEPTDTRAKAALGKVLLLNGKADEAVPYFREAVRLVPQSILLWADYSQALAESGNTTRAIEEARATAVKASENPEILKRMGILLLDLDQARAAERPLSRYAAFNYSSGEANLLHGRALLRTGLFSGARMAFQRAAQAASDQISESTINWYLFATEAMGQKLEEAENRLPTLRASDRPKDVPASLIGQVFLDKGEPELAASAFREAIQAGPTDALVIGLSRALFATGARQAGIRELEDYLVNADVARLARIELARRYEQEERFSDAALQYERLLQTGVADADVVAKLAIVYLRLGNRASTQLAERAYLMAPENPAILDAAGWIALQADRETNKAIGYLEKAVRRAPAEALYKYHLGVAYVAKGDRRSARRVLQQALNLDPSFDGADDARRQLQELSF
ncbi:MAG: PEP-CTERM system TPR-repeat protein PrsT [Kordiimonadaceae bacterium]|nr:PEP-CTERM system TPR-repeat protein PrsT [Kordiimonadaceae bacterium]MBO6570432.1 PEP-CTERM system TPR-repeat protein PrsT [Kordiimonadaceae bacterium]MBO6965470.1 PEP-CTERM system TPR-repeat protein PrsT [Kordiimonadaceae bacterium]